MYAIVEIAGQQFKVEENQEIFVHRLQAAEGSYATFEEVLLVDNEGEITVGQPVIDSMAVNVTVLEHVKGDKVIIFKKKRRKGYRKKNGHRQYFTKIRIDSIGAPRPAEEMVKEEETAEVVETEDFVAAVAAPVFEEETKETTEVPVPATADGEAVIEDTEENVETVETVETVEQSIEATEEAVKRGVEEVIEATVEADDLTKVEGIGPKIAELFNDAGIHTFTDLAGKTEEELKAILKDGGSRFAMKNPSTWAQQAQMAADGKWDELKQWQDVLDGGIEK